MTNGNGGDSVAEIALKIPKADMTRSRLWAICFLLFLASAQARADAALLLEEPYGEFGEVNPTGHAAIYLSRVCAASPTLLRRCLPGETGVVISRYYRIAGYDWLAISLSAYLYAVDDPTRVPEFANAELVSDLRDRYRRSHLEMLAPDGPNGATPRGEWTLLAGEAYDRKIYGFQIETSQEQDDELIQVLNQEPNHRTRRQLTNFLISHNCADFARGIFNFYYPHSVHRNFFADAGVTTPKQVASSLVKYARRHPDLQFFSFVIQQVPGSMHRSHPVDGVAEALVRTKKYLVPLALLHPFITGSVALLYLGEGRFSPSRQVKRFPTSPEIAAFLQSRQENVFADPQTDPFKSLGIADAVVLGIR